jgi:D-alanine-D-alanine ligase
LVFGGRSVEHEVSLVSARTVRRGLREAGHEVVELAIAEDGSWLNRERSAAALDGAARSLPGEGGAVAPTLRHLLAAVAERVEVVFPIAHGTWGEDGTLQGLCEMLDLPYVGANVPASAVAMDKRLCKEVLAQAGIPVVPFRSVQRPQKAQRAGFDAGATIAALGGLPLFVKPSAGGSSVGVRKVETADRLAAAVDFAFEFDDAVLIERGIAGRELECAVLGYPDLEASEVGEIVPGNEFYDYEDKYLKDAAELRAPAPLDARQRETVRSLACAAFQAIGGSGMARVDFFLEHASGEVLVNEINTLPGFTAISMFPRLWGLSGLPLPALVDRLVRDAQRRHAERHRLDRGIKEWLGRLAQSAKG